MSNPIIDLGPGRVTTRLAVSFTTSEDGGDAREEGSRRGGWLIVGSGRRRRGKWSARRKEKGLSNRGFVTRRRIESNRNGPERAIDRTRDARDAVGGGGIGHRGASRDVASFVRTDDSVAPNRGDGAVFWGVGRGVDDGGVRHGDDE